jgi:hypothetical protein
LSGRLSRRTSYWCGRRWRVGRHRWWLIGGHWRRLIGWKSGGQSARTTQRLSAGSSSWRTWWRCHRLIGRLRSWLVRWRFGWNICVTRDRLMTGFVRWLSRWVDWRLPRSMATKREGLRCIVRYYIIFTKQTFLRRISKNCVILFLLFVPRYAKWI